MSYWSSPQRAPVNARHPKAQAICDRCSMLYHHDALSRQMEWSGNNLTWTGFLVCRSCLDIPFELNRPLRLPPDPVPIKDPRPPMYIMLDEELRQDGGLELREDGGIELRQ
jgi:hypothetical protein